KNNAKYVKARGVINNPKAFDPAFFGINPKLAALMDPQQRIFLEIAWEVLERANHVPEKFQGSIGVYAGCRFNTYYTHNVISNKELIETVGAFQVGTVSDKDYIASRAAFALNLNGPAVNVQSACSTSLLAVAQAVQSIRAGQCDVAIAGGSSMLVPINSGHLYEEGAMFSKDGHSRTFDANAAGTVFSDGAAVVLLKSKRQAELDGDLIYGVIKGVGLSNDGRDKGSFTAPSAEGQANAILMAINDAGVKPEQISYIEAHGTATPLGDPIEIEGLKMAFGAQSTRQFCAIGSLKSNIGHLTAASGVTGLIKTALSLYHKQIPASINYEKPNPHINFEESPFFVNSKLRNWTANNRIAGVSSFGVGGTNVHVIVAEHNIAESISGASKPLDIITLSAKNEWSLNAFSENLSNYLVNTKSLNISDLAFTLNTQRNGYANRKFLLASNVDSTINEIAVSKPKKTVKSDNEIVFMFPGQGSQFVGMGRALYQHEPVFKAAVDECALHFKALTGEDIVSVIYPDNDTEKAEKILKDTKYSQPALFTLGYALSKLWMSWGIYPSAFIGHSIGEFVAAYFSGIFSLGDAIKIITSRGMLMSELPSGSMLSVRGTLAEIKQMIPPDISIAAINSPSLFVLAGETEEIERLSQQFENKDIVSKILQTSHAFHSHMMDDVLIPFRAVLKEIACKPPLIPIFSAVTGNKLSEADAKDVNYWANHLRKTVNFEAAATSLLTEFPDAVFIEMGPGNATTTFLKQHHLGKDQLVINSLDFPKSTQNAYHSILRALGQLWVAGYNVNWNLYHAVETRKKLSNLPTYAFNKSTYWIEPKQLVDSMTSIESNLHNHTLQTKPLTIMRKQTLITQLKGILENASGIEMTDATPEMTFIEIGLD
ncbi:MAG: type I polyketide synthase, partial [Sphingobacteriales bacterium]